MGFIRKKPSLLNITIVANSRPNKNKDAHLRCFHTFVLHGNGCSWWRLLPSTLPLPGLPPWVTLLMLPLEQVPLPLWLKLLEILALLKPPPSSLHLTKPLPNSPQVRLRALLLNKPKLSLPDMLSLEPLSKPLMLPPEMLRPLEEKLLVLSRLLKVAFKLLTRVKPST